MTWQCAPPSCGTVLDDITAQCPHCGSWRPIRLDWRTIGNTSDYVGHRGFQCWINRISNHFWVWHATAPDIMARAPTEGMATVLVTAQQECETLYYQYLHWASNETTPEITPLPRSHTLTLDWQPHQTGYMAHIPIMNYRVTVYPDTMHIIVAGLELPYHEPRWMYSYQDSEGQVLSDGFRDTQLEAQLAVEAQYRRHLAAAPPVKARAALTKTVWDRLNEDEGDN